MSDIKEILAQALEDEPPALWRERESAIIAGRHAARRRRTMRVAGALAATTGLALAGLLAGVLGPDGDAGRRGATAAAGSPPATAASPPATAASTRPAATIAVLERAAGYAEAQPFTPPRPDQWIYVEVTSINKGAIARSKGRQPDERRRSWQSADGKKRALINAAGRLEVFAQAGDYARLAALPTDPPALLDHLEDLARQGPQGRRGPQGSQGQNLDTDEAVNAMLFESIAGTLRESVLPPAVKAAFLRAAALIPGVTEASEKVDVGGRSATQVGRVQDGWRRESILLDADTYEFIGQRGVAVKDHDFPYSDGAQDRTVHVPKGEVQHVLIRSAGGIVDAAGETK